MHSSSIHLPLNQSTTLYSIQYLRAFAALLVVFHHARIPLPWLYDPLAEYKGLAFGVDIFFVISGFVMYSAAKSENVVEFLRRRIVRIVPLYWIATITLFLLSEKRNILSIGSDKFLHIAKSLLFIPHWNLGFPSEIWPYLVPGWTLNYEMFFYFIFAVGLAFRKIEGIVSAGILLLVLIGAVYCPSGAIASTYTSPMLLEFLFGIWIA